MVLLKATCPDLVSDSAGDYKLVVLQMGHPDRWRTGVVVDWQMVIEGPQADTPLRALNECFDAIARKLAEHIPRAWSEKDDDDQQLKIGVREDGTGARFAVEKDL